MDQSLLEIFFSESDYKMVNINKKTPTYRQAIAEGKIQLHPHVVEQIKNNTLPKGNAVILAEIAGIQGAKSAPQTIPLCHPLNLNHVNIKIDFTTNTILTVYCLASAFSKTGVEMEALAGVQAAILALYDLAKNVNPNITILSSRLLLKEGGKSGLWLHADGLPNSLKKLIRQDKSSNKILSCIPTAVITLSQRASSGEYKDQSGPKLKEQLELLGADVKDYTILPDNREKLQNHILSVMQNKNPSLIITTGGTGCSPMDITTDTIQALCNRSIPGIGELLRQSGAQYTNHSWLSRSFAGIKNNTLIICLPGNPKAVIEGINILKQILPHALKLICGETFS